jgi:RimJ/RimL family protein N-acetyltransferase
MTLDLAMPTMSERTPAGTTGPRGQTADIDRSMADGLGRRSLVRTQRLTLREHRMTDAAALAQSLSDFQVVRMLAQVPQPYHPADARDWLEDVLDQAGKARPEERHRGRHDAWYIAITDATGADPDAHVGAVNVERRREGWHLGYWLNRGVWGRGVMTEAVSAVLTAFFERLPGETIVSGAFADNSASLKIQAKLGFAVTGVTDVFVPARNVAVNRIATRLTQADFLPVR